MLNINKINKQSLEDIEKEESRILQQMQDLAAQIETTEQTILGFQKDRESAWEKLQDAEEKEKAARKTFLIKHRPDYESAYNEHLSFLSRGKVLTTYTENNLKLEEYFVSECEQNITNDVNNQDYWQNCKRAHENRIKLYREELARLSQYIEQRQDEFKKFELATEFEIWGKADEAVKFAISESTDAKGAVMSIVSQIETSQAIKEDLTKKYDEIKAEHEKISEIIEALKKSQA